MRRFYLLCLFTLVLCNGSQSQTTMPIDKVHYELSPSETRHTNIHADMNSRLFQQKYLNPAFYDMSSRDSTHAFQRYRSSVYSVVGVGKLNGDFLPVEGNKFSDFRIAAIGEHRHKRGGTLFGFAQYSRGKHENIGWSATRYPQLYQPYLSTDSTGGHFNYEDYRVEGGYSFRLKDWSLGIGIKFHGEQAWRSSDPRTLNNTTWFRTSVGIGRTLGSHHIMLRGGYGRNKQHLSSRYWRPGQQDRYFVTYGFGLYDIRNSTVTFGYSRMYYINEFTAGLDYSSPQSSPLQLNAGIGIQYNDMKAEESSIQELYRSRTLSVKPQLRLDYRPAKQFSLSLHAEAQMERRKGYENIYDEYLIDKYNNVYDFRHIDTQQNYLLTLSQALVQLKAGYRLNPIHDIAVTAGIMLNSREEKYSAKDFFVRNKSMFPHCRLDYTLNLGKVEWNMGILYGRQLRINNHYEVEMQNKKIEYLDFQHAFTPYAFYNSTYSTAAFKTTCAVHFKSYALGASLNLMLTYGQRDESAVYENKIGFPSSAPRISATPDKHNEQWSNMTLFFIF